MSSKRVLAIVAGAVLICAVVVVLVLIRPGGHRPLAGVLGFWTKHQLIDASPLHGPGFRQAPAPAQSAQAHPALLGIRVGALFLRQGTADHFCTASVVDSPGRDLLVTAAHCIHSGKGGSYRQDIVFIPGYRDGQAPFGIWTVRQLLVAPQWADASDPDFDVGFVVLNSLGGKNIEDILGANRLGLDTGYQYVVRVTGYPSSGAAPITCLNQTTEESFSQLRFECGGYTGGTSGSPWLTNFDRVSRTGTIVGVIGGYQQGGDTPQISYSAFIGPAIQHLYQQVISDEGVSHRSKAGLWGTYMDMEDAGKVSHAGNGQIVVAGAGYAGLHVALRLAARQRNSPLMELTLVDQHDYHQVITELPRVAGGARAADAVRIPLQDVLAARVRFVQTEIAGFDLAGRQLLTRAGPVTWGRLVLALGSRPNDFAIPGLAERALSLYSASDAERVWAAVRKALAAAGAAADPGQQRRLATVVVGGGGATGVELAGELAEMLPKVASGHGLAAGRPAVRLVEAGPVILAGSSPKLIDKATRILSDLGVQVRTNATIAAATQDGFRLSGGELVQGGVFVWAGGLKAPGVVADSALPTGHNGRVKVDKYLRVLDHPEIYVAGDLASVVDPRTGHVLPPLAQVALEEGETVARNLEAELTGGQPEAFSFRDKGFVVSVGTRRGVADVAGITAGGRLAHALKDAIEWEYRQSVRHLRGWDPVAV